MSDVHAWWAWVMVVGNTGAGIWALGAHADERFRGRALWWATAVVQLTIFVQIALGVWIVAVDDIEVDDLHLFYGFVAGITVGIIYSYRSQLAHRIYLLYGFGGLFLAGLGLRAIILPPT